MVYIGPRKTGKINERDVEEKKGKKYDTRAQ